jgi:hypothetical protein
MMEARPEVLRGRGGRPEKGVALPAGRLRLQETPAGRSLDHLSSRFGVELSCELIFCASAGVAGL